GEEQGDDRAALNVVLLVAEIGLESRVHVGERAAFGGRVRERQGEAAGGERGPAERAVGQQPRERRGLGGTAARQLVRKRHGQLLPRGQGRGKGGLWGLSHPVEKSGGFGVRRRERVAGPAQAAEIGVLDRLLQVAHV